MSQIPALRRLRVELGLDCPLHCVHCSAHAAPGHPRTLHTAAVRRLIEEFGAMGGEEITFTGGEPLVNASLPMLLGEATACGLRTVIFTSGLVHGEQGPVSAPPDMLDALAPLLHRAVFSLYAADPRRHDSVTADPGSFPLTVGAIRSAIAACIPAEIHVVPTRRNFRELPALVDLAARLGVSTVRVIRYMPHGRGATNRDALSLRPEEHRELRDLLQGLAQATDVDVRVGSGFGYLLDDAPPCSAAIDELVITSDGRIYPCSGFVGFHLGGDLSSIWDGSLEEVWRDAPYLRAVRGVLGSRTSDGNIACGGHGCIAQVAIATGMLSGTVPDPDAFASPYIVVASRSDADLVSVASRR